MIASARQYDANGNPTNTNWSTGLNSRLLSVGTYRYVYLCPCQLAGVNFLRAAGRRLRRGIGRCSFSQRSMAA